MIVAVSGRGDVSGFFNTQMVLDLNGKCIEFIVPRCSLEYSACASMNYLIMVFCVRDLRGYRWLPQDALLHDSVGLFKHYLQC